MSGRQNRKRLLRIVRRWDFTLLTAAIIAGVFGIVVGAIYDLVTTAKDKDQRIQETELRGQLAQFLLSTREPDGSSLLENATEFAEASRPLSVVSLRRSFFGYLLNSGNARSFKVGDIGWEAPRACQVEFPGAGGGRTVGAPLQACFAAIPKDPTGRYIYFSLRYPVKGIVRHFPGRPLSGASRVELTFSGQAKTRLTLVYQIPPLARARYPSQLARFEGLHELAAFLSDEVGRPTRLVGGQAFERLVDEPDATVRSYVTLLGRVDVAALVPSDSETGDWPTARVKSLQIGVRVYDFVDGESQDRVIYDVAPGAKGTTMVSLSQAYLTAVTSRARMEIVASTPGKRNQTIWRSTDTSFAEPSRIRGRWQAIADKWAAILVSRLSPGGASVRSELPVQVAGYSKVMASIQAVPVSLPDIATRAFAWLSAALLCLGLLALHVSIYIYRLLKLRASAYAMAVRPSRGGDLSSYALGRDEVGTLGRVFHALIAKNRLHSVNTLRRLRLEERRRIEALRLEEAHVRNRKSILDAIGHEIRSPLQSLLTRTRGDPDVQMGLSRIRRAVEALHDAASVEDGLARGEIVIVRQDLAGFLRRFAINLVDAGKYVVYVGPESMVYANFDSIQLEQILDNLIDNAIRHRTVGTPIELQLQVNERSLTVTVFNEGPNVPEADLDRIFDLGVSGSQSPESSGLGLFASRIYGLAMKVTLHARNETGGVSLVLTFPSPLEDSDGK